MSAATLASRLEQRFSARPHVGVVTHFEGWDVPRTAAHLVRALTSLGWSFEDAVEDIQGQTMFSAVAAVPVGEGMELWLLASERPAVGTKLEIRLFHVLEEAALADEHLARFAARIAEVGAAHSRPER